MSESVPPHIGPTRDASPLSLRMRQFVVLERETLLFYLAHSLDVLMTYVLLTHNEVNFVESNPIARYVLFSFGFTGMAAYKFSLISLVAVICQYIARTRIEIARRILNYATLVVSGVVFYSLFLLQFHSYLT